ncbi:MAG: alpha-2-macroglobulin family protein [Elusimicrobiaceae bacterium]|nr:alpha-2-macroglobulin family protein [Elusimicrobiaceae bacterium]
MYSAMNVPQVLYAQKSVAEGDFITEYGSMKASAGGAPALPEGVEPKALEPRARVNSGCYGGIDLSTATPFVFTGVYLPSRAKWAWAFDNVTGIGLTVKSSPVNGLVWTTDLSAGEPLGRVNITLRDGKNNVVWTGRTDGDGLAELPGWGALGLAADSEWESPDLWAFAEKKGDIAALSLDFASGLEPWRFGLPARFEKPAGTARTLVFTDRGLYRPGETVSVKGFLRRYGKKGVTYAGVRELAVTVADGGNATVSSFTASVSDSSSFDFSFPLSKTAGPGFWSVRLSNPDPAGPKVDEQANFQVEAFKRAQFAVSVTPLQKNYYRGDTFSAAVDGWYLAGAPMAGAEAEWSLLLSPAPFAPCGLGSYTFVNADYTPDRVLAAGRGRLDENGRLSFSVAGVTATVTRPYSLIAEASVLSPDMQRLFSRTAATLHPADFYLGVAGPWRVEKSTTPVFAGIVSVRPDGAPAPGVAVTAGLARREYRNAARAGLSGRLEIVSEEKIIPVSTFSYTSGSGEYRWPIPQDLPPGSYRLALNGERGGRANATAFTFYVPGDGGVSWERDDTDLVALAADKSGYKPGDTAKIMIKSPFEKAWALITVESAGVVESRVERISGGAEEIKLKLRAGHVPNIYVGVVLVNGRTAKPTASSLDAGKPKAKFGYINIPVSPDENRLIVRLKPETKEYRPGAEAAVEIRTLDAEGDGTPAEVAFYAVDEGVLNLTDYGTPDPFGAVYETRPLGVKTADSRPLVLGQRNFGEKGENRGGGGGGAAGGVDIRSNFIPLAAWMPAVMTDRKGSARVAFRLPDTLTSYRIIAVAASETRFGSSTDTIRVSKPLMLKAALPRFARKGDTFKAGAVLINYSTATVSARVEMNVSGALAAAANAPSEVTLKAGAAKRLEWSFSAISTGPAALVFTARAGEESDGLEQEIPVVQGELPETTAVSMAIARSGVQTLKRPADALSAELAVVLSPTALASLKLPAEYLLGYRYECLEQKLSKLAPLLVSEKFARRWLAQDTDALKKQASELFANLASYKGPGGGFGYWEDSSYSDPWLTSYVLETYAAASKRGYRADPPVIAGAVNYLQGLIKNGSGDSAAYALYALALNGSFWPDAFARLYGARDTLSGEGVSCLLRAASRLGVKDEQRAELSRMLLNRQNIGGDAAFFGETAFSARSHASAVKTTALCMQALLESDGTFPAAGKVARWLVRQQKNGRWNNTADNAAALRALEYYYSAYEKPEQAFTAKVTAGADALMRVRFENLAPVLATAAFDALMLTRSSASVPVRFEKDGDGRLYYTMALKTVPAAYKTPLARGFSVTRAVKAPGGGKLRPGVRAEVTVSVNTAQDRYFVALEDFVAAGFEIVNTDLSGQAGVASAGSADAGWFSGDYAPGFHKVQRYDDRIAAFAEFLPAGQHEFTYMVQAVAEGDYGAPAGFVSCMYEPDVFGRTATGRVKILPLAK